MKKRGLFGLGGGLLVASSLAIGIPAYRTYVTVEQRWQRHPAYSQVNRIESALSDLRKAKWHLEENSSSVLMTDGYSFFVSDVGSKILAEEETRTYLRNAIHKLKQEDGGDG